jgi:uncharacterized protein
MSKRNEESISNEQILNEDVDPVVDRKPPSSFSVFPLFVLFCAYLLFTFISKGDTDIQLIKEAVLGTAKVPNNLKQTESSNTVNIHQLITNASVSDVEKYLYQLDYQTINEVANGMTPIMIAASLGSVEKIDLLFTQGADPNKRGSMDRTALQYATEKNHIAAAKRLLAYGAEIDAYDNGRLSPLIMAADRGYTELGILFIEKGADVNLQHTQGWTALIDAARNGDKKLVLSLLAAGADRNISMKNEMKAIDFARQNGHNDIVKILGR